MSVLVEAVQLALPLGRSVDVDDVILNVLGVALGGLAGGFVVRWWSRSRDLPTFSFAGAD